ncbi:hypothetical protein J8F10_30275 [Gemmata sp. G18]|uniref:Uncharacterized protein n=1 Tax=Gemmata palustris TaxID=2822762 RepID=A0ABS5C0P2_9BACT|nr:hypothetical protein [Gemmata palustris]MBP3959552.1 hypothetical protein [Gemmata palustris]
MGVSIYYEARRDHPLSTAERQAIADIDRRHALASGANETGEWVNAPYWESFCIYEPNEDTEPGVIFEGATKLPLTTEDEFWEAIQHWCRVLTLIRRVLAGATWSVDIDHRPVVWNGERNEYDPSIDADNA